MVAQEKKTNEEQIYSVWKQCFGTQDKNAIGNLEGKECETQIWRRKEEHRELKEECRETIGRMQRN